MEEPTWTMVLRCYECSGKFTLSHMPLDQLTSLPLVAVCPHCGKRPEAAAKGQTKVHRIFDLRCDRSSKSAA